MKDSIPQTNVHLERRSSVLIACQLFVFATYPVLQAVQISLGLPTRGQVVARALVAVVVAVSSLLWVLRFFKWDLVGRATWLSWVLVLFAFYIPAVAAARAAGLPVYVGHPAFSIGYLLISLAGAGAIARPWTSNRRDTWPLSVAAILLVSWTALPMARSILSDETDRGLQQSNLMIEDASRVAGPASATPPERDVYYVVLDGFGRSDVLGEYYGDALDSFRANLRSRGFYIAEQARSNYAQTFLSLSSTLNMVYLDDLATVMGPRSQNRLPLERLIQENALMSLARKAGYRVVAISSDYMATARFDHADVCYCSQYGLDEFEQLVVGLTPFAGLPLTRWTYGAHRRKVLSSFDALEKVSELPGPKFVFAHIVAPHPPFVLGRDSEENAFGGPFIFNDGDDYIGSRSAYVSGYSRQVQVVAQRFQAVVDRWLASTRVPPVVVVHGDHGPGSMLRVNDPEATDMRERMSIFAAYHFPGGDGDDDEPYATMSPLNGARILSNRYFGSDFEILPDRSYFSRWDRPFDLIPVSAAERQAQP